MKTLIIIGVLLLGGCTTSKFQSGTYRVESARNMNGRSIVHLEGVKKEFVFDTDTLKKGDLIYFVDRNSSTASIHR